MFYVREPGKGGDSFAAGILERLLALAFAGALREICLAGAKDPTELHALERSAFVARMQLALETASAVELPPTTSAEAGAPKLELIVEDLPTTVRKADRALADLNVFQRSGIARACHDRSFHRA